MTTNNNYLLITLGHNSSAMFIDNTNENKQEIIGYEQERLSRIKSDSQFPFDAINEIKKHVPFSKLDRCQIRISHWFDDFRTSSNKYIGENGFRMLKEISTNIVDTNGNSFTHHDAHAYSAYNFMLESNTDLKYFNKPIYCIVADGFGNQQEVFSIYAFTPNVDTKPKRIFKSYGYYQSLGLMYQFATSFVGMKENQDEYKFLGYESHIAEVLSEQQIATLTSFAKFDSIRMIKRIKEHTKKEQILNIDKNIGISITDLDNARNLFNHLFSRVFESLNIDKDTNIYISRVIMGYYVQCIIESVITSFIDEYEMNNICVAGGCFYNVKLNNSILEAIDGYFSAMPLAGDQGAAIGMYAKEVGFNSNISIKFNTLNFGKRNFYNADKLVSKINNAYYFTNSKYAAMAISDFISNDCIVNIIHNDMEFGPRALGHTSTLFLPTEENVAFVNYINNRNEVMPCAPICTIGSAHDLFDSYELSRTVGSDRFMICTHKYMRKYNKLYGGVMHKKPLIKDYTGRPQIVTKNENFLYTILESVKKDTGYTCLVNTSFNVHGQPIVFDIHSIIQNFMYQQAQTCTHKFNKKVVLVIIND